MFFLIFCASGILDFFLIHCLSVSSLFLRLQIKLYIDFLFAEDLGAACCYQIQFLEECRALSENQRAILH